MPIVFQDFEHFKNAVNDKIVLEKKKEWLSTVAPSIEAAVKSSVTGNTFRAFRFRSVGIHDLAPSSVYREWTNLQLNKDKNAICKIESFESMMQYVIDTASKLDKDWSEKTKGRNKIGFGRSAKLLNLSIKHLLHLDKKLCPELNKSEFIKYLNVPLDSYTIQAIRNICPELNIPKNASMGYIQDENQYRKFQNTILELTKKSNNNSEREITPFDYEFAVWNAAHLG